METLIRNVTPTFNLLPTPLKVTEEKRKVAAGTNLAKCEMVNFLACPHFDNCSGEPKLSMEIPKHLTEFYERSTKDLVNVEQSKKVFDLLCENATVFSSDSSDLGRTAIVKHQIKTSLSKPNKQPWSRLPLAKRDVASQAVDEMLKRGVIKPSTSSWSSRRFLAFSLAFS